MSDKQIQIVPMPDADFDPEFQSALLHTRLNVLFDSVAKLRDVKADKDGSVKATDREFITVQEVRQILPVSDKTVRWWIFYNSYGFHDRCIIKRGRRIYIDRAALVQWIAEGNPALALKRQKGKGNG